MNPSHVTFLRYISMIQRNTQRYFDLHLEEDQIGSGQQFFLLRIAEQPGITMQDLAKLGGFDKGTVTKAVQKLSEQGYVTIEVDAEDKRVRHLTPTAHAQKVISHIYAIRDKWIATLTQGFNTDEQTHIFHLLERMAQNAYPTLEEGFANWEDSSNDTSY